MTPTYSPTERARRSRQSTAARSKRKMFSTTLGRWSMEMDLDAKLCARQRALMAQAQDKTQDPTVRRWVLRTLWIAYRLRLPLVEAELS